MANTHTRTRTLPNLISSLFCCPSLCFFLLILLYIYFCFPSHSLGASSQDLLYSLGQRTFVLFQWEYVLFPSQHHDVVGVCASMSLCNLCVAETDVISQKTSVSHVLKEEKVYAKPCTWLGYHVCQCLCVLLYVWLLHRDELLLLHKSASKELGGGMRVYVSLHRYHNCSREITVCRRVDKNPN